MAKVFKDDVSKLLSEPGKEVDISNVAKDENAVLGLYFSAHWCPPCRAFTPQLAEWYKKFKESKNGSKLEIVFVSSDRDESSFKEYFDEMPWLALPYSNREEKARLSKKHKVSGIPTLVLVDATTGKVITTDGRAIVADDPDGIGFPWAPKSFSEIMDGTLVSKDGEIKWEDVKEEVVGVYFSAHWCGPCRSFTPQLVKTYNKIKEDGKKFQIIFVSSDRDEESFKEYYESMPWLAIPFGDQRKKSLSRRFEISGIPSLVIMKGEEVITTGGRSAIAGDTEGKDFPWIPKPVNPLNPQFAGELNDNPALIYFLDDSENKENVIETLEKIAIAHIASKAENPVHFFYHIKDDDDGDLKSSLQTFASFEDKHNLVFIDIPSQRVFATTAENGCDSAKGVLEKYMSDTLEFKPLRIQ